MRIIKIVRNFRNLDVYKRSVEFTKEIYLVTGNFPDNEKFGLSSQLQRASVSIASNIAEGSSRRSEADFARFLEISMGSAFEVETQLIIAKQLNYLSEKRLKDLLDTLTIIQKQINNLISKLRHN